MRLMVILTLGLGFFEPTLIDGEKIVFVVPRYVRRSFSTNSNPFYNKGERGFKVRGSLRGVKRPYFNGPPTTNEGPFFPGEKYRFPQHPRHQQQQHHQLQQLQQQQQYGRDEFDQGSLLNHHQEVNHVVIPHGKGISHGISFGKEYIPENYDHFKGMNDNYEFPVANENQVDYMNENENYGDVKFEDTDPYSRFKGQDQTGHNDWRYSPPKSSYTEASNFGQEPNQDDRRFEFDEMYKTQDQRSNEHVAQQHYYPSYEQSHGAISTETSSPSSEVTSAHLVAAPKAPAPIILQDTVDMKEYVEKIEAFAKSWPAAAALQGFGMQNQAFKAFPGFMTPNFQGFNSWTSNLHGTTKPSGSYQVQEENTEQPNYGSQGNFRMIRI